MGGPLYHYLDRRNEAVGPLPLADIRALAEAGTVRWDVPVCAGGGQQWTPLYQLGTSPPADGGAESPSHLPAIPRHDPPRALPVTYDGPPPRVVRVHTVADHRPRTAASHGPAGEYPGWFPLASMLVGILAVLVIWSPWLAVLLAAPALTMGVLAIRSAPHQSRSLSVAGIATASVALVLVLGAMMLGIAGGGMVGAEAAAIERVLNRDAHIYHAAADKYPDDAVEQTRYIAVQMQKIDLRNCPPEFRVAYQRHINAWKVSIPYVAANTPLTAFLEGLVSGYTGNYSLLGGANYQAQMALQQVSTTYQDVSTVAAAYGARIPTSQ